MMDFDMDYDDGVEFGAGEPAVAQQFKGYLMKKSPNKMRVNRWQKRWFVLEGSVLSWWEKAEHESTKNALGSTDLAGSEVTIDGDEIAVKGDDRSLVLRAESAGDAAVWEGALRTASDGPQSPERMSGAEDGLKRLTLGDSSDSGDELEDGFGLAAGATGAASSPPKPPAGPLPERFEVTPGDIVLGDHIGKGICSESKRAKFKGRDVVVKMLHNFDTSAELLAAFTSLAKSMSMIPAHPNVLGFLAACTQPPDLCTVYDAHDRNLESLLGNSGVGTKERVAIARGLADGLAHVHTHFGPHGGLRSTNVLLKGDGSVCVADYGFGKVKEYTGTGARIMKMPGLYNYTAPEVLRSEPATVAADVYSFGAILWELASKARPFDNMDQMGVITHVGFGQQRLATPAGADPRFGALIGLISSCAHPAAAERAALADAIQLLAT